MRQVVRAAAGMSLEVREAFFLALQRGEQGKQGDVLVDVSEVAGVEAVSILHRGRSLVRQAPPRLSYFSPRGRLVGGLGVGLAGAVPAAALPAADAAAADFFAAAGFFAVAEAFAGD